MAHKRLIVALDFKNFDEMSKFAEKLDPNKCIVKVGLQLFISDGLRVLDYLSDKGFDVFLDLKLHDIPNTVKNGLEALDKIKPIFTTIHVSGGDEMMKSSVENKKFTKILGVSILTSMDAKQTKKYYNQKNISFIVKKFAKFAKKNGLDGVVCSPKEIKVIRKETGKNFLIVTPGIRLVNKIKGDDQKRVETPEKAIEMGANYLVIGRPITKSKNPLKTLKQINKTLS